MAASREQAIKNISKAHTKEIQAKAQATRKANADIRLIRNEVYDNLKKQLLNPDGKGKAYYDNFINKFLKIAEKDPNSKCGQIVANTIFQNEILTILDEQHQKEMDNDRDFQRYKLIKDFFQEQRDVILETNHQKKILICCSRRAGKTDTASGAINYAAIIPNSRIIYINLTFTNAIRQIWDNVVKESEKAGLTISKSSKTDGSIEWANGSSLRIMGNPNNSEIDKLRGERKVSLVIIDEFFHQRNLEYGINEVITPFLADRADSTIIAMGTPPRIAHTYGEKCWNEKGWKKYHWTLHNNPYIPDPEKFIKDICEQKGIDINSPFIQREFFGVIGQYDTEALVFKGRKTHNSFDENTPITNIVIGVDYGFSDYNSIISVAYNTKEKKSYVISESKFNKATVSEIKDRIKDHYNRAKALIKKNNLKPEDTIKIYCDTNEESITSDLLVVDKLPAFNCYKYDKAYAIEMLAEELRTGRMTIPHNGILDEEMEQILYKRDEDTDAIIPELDEEIGIHADAMMALLYASRKIFFDFNYEIEFKESQPQTSNYIKNDQGTIIGVVNPKENDEFEYILDPIG